MELLTISEVCKLYPNIKRATVYRLIQSGAWDTFLSKIGSLRVNREGLEKWIEAGGELAGKREEEQPAMRKAPRANRSSPRKRLSRSKASQSPSELGFRIIERLKPSRDPFSQ